MIAMCWIVAVYFYTSLMALILIKDLLLTKILKTVILINYIKHEDYII